MKMYLSSYEIGDEIEKLKSLIPINNKAGYIPNARDFTGVDLEKKAIRDKKDMNDIKKAGMDVELLDLKDYFGKKKKLQDKIDSLGVLWVSGGNVFVLRQAMKLSGLDEIMKTLIKRDDFLYGGYSAAGCVLSPTLDGYSIVDDATDTPYKELKDVIWEGLGIISYTFLPHFESKHPESDDINKELEYCKKKGLPYMTLRDGEVIIVE